MFFVAGSSTSGTDIFQLWWWGTFAGCGVLFWHFQGHEQTKEKNEIDCQLIK